MLSRILSIGFIFAILWTLVIGFGFYKGWFISAIAASDDLSAFSAAVEEKVKNNKVGNISIAVIEDGEIAYEFQHSIGEVVSKNSVFQIASASKWVTVWGVLSLVEQGKLDLDAPASRYLTRWTFPPSSYEQDNVTIRRLLSHTAGVSSFGYFGFEHQENLQSLEESLVRADDVVPPGETAVVGQGEARIVNDPGAAWDYTGAGYTILQLLIEEVSGQDFSSYMESHVFSRLNMDDSTFDWRRAEDGNLAVFYDEDGSVTPHYIYAAKAAAALYTSTDDLARFVRAHFANGTEKPGRGIVSPTDLHLARETHGEMYGLGVYGLGTFLYASNNQGDVIFGHDGSNYPAINTAVRINPTTRDAIIVFCTGNTGLATQLAGDWVLWNTGNADLVSLLRIHSSDIIRMILIGWMAFGLAIIFGVIRLFRRNSAR